MTLPLDLRSVLVQHPSKLELKFAHYFSEDLSGYEWIRDPYVQPIPSSFTEEKKEDYIDLTCDSSLKRVLFNSVLLTNFWNFLNDEYPALTNKALRILVPFPTSYLCEAGFSATAIIKTKCQSRIDVEREIREAVSKILPRFHDLCKNKQAHTSHQIWIKLLINRPLVLFNISFLHWFFFSLLRVAILLNRTLVAVFLWPGRRKLSLLLQRRRNQKSLRITAQTQQQQTDQPKNLLCRVYCCRLLSSNNAPSD